VCPTAGEKKNKIVHVQAIYWTVYTSKQKRKKTENGFTDHQNNDKLRQKPKGCQKKIEIAEISDECSRRQEDLLRFSPSCCIFSAKMFKCSHLRMQCP